MEEAKAKEDIRQLNVLLPSLMDKELENTITGDRYDALVVTDAQLTIKWVNPGFSDMTGYAKSYAIGKTPHFLQGEKTTDVSRKAIRKGLNNKVTFNQSVINYKKNGEEYLCEIKIIPLFDNQNQVTNYLAVEKEIKVAS